MAPSDSLGRRIHLLRRSYYPSEQVTHCNMKQIPESEILVQEFVLCPATGWYDLF